MHPMKKDQLEAIERVIRRAEPKQTCGTPERLAARRISGGAATLVRARRCF